MPPSLYLAILLLVPSSFSIANKTPRHVPAGSSGLSFGGAHAGASSFASSSAYSSGGAFGGNTGVKGGCAGGCGGAIPSGGAISGGQAGSGNFASGFGSGFGGGSSSSFASAGGGHGVFPGGDDLANVAFWWAGPDSPFKTAQEYYKNCALKGDCASVPGPFKIPGFDPSKNLPCGPSGCGGVKTIGKESFGPIDISNNPFLNGEYKGVAISSCSGSACPGGKPHVTVTNCKGSDCKTIKHEGEPTKPLDLSGNPFLSGAFAGSGSFGSGSVFTEGASSGSSFKGSHGAGADIAHGKGPGFVSGSGVFASGSSGTFGQPQPTSQTQTGHTGSFQHGSTAFGSSGSSTFGHGQASPTAPSHTGTTSSFHQTTGFGASGSSNFGSSGSGSFGTAQIGGKPNYGQSCTFGSDCKNGVPSKEITPPSFGGPQPTKSSCYPGQVGCQTKGQYPGSYPGETKPSTHGQKPSYEPGKPSCSPGQPGCSTGGQYPGSYSGQTGKPATHGQQPSYQPGKPACSSGQPGCQDGGQYPGTHGQQPSYQPGKPSCSPGQPGCQTGGQYPDSYPGETKPSTHGQQPSYQPGKPSCTPGQPGCQDGGQYSGTHGQQPSYQPGKPSCSPGQPGCQDGGQYPGTHGQQPSSSCSPGQPGCQTGSHIPSSYPGEQGKPSSGSHTQQPSKTCTPGQFGCQTGNQGSYSGEGQPGKQCYPGQIGCQPSGQTPGQYPGETGKPGKQCYPGQIGCQPSGQTPGQYPGETGKPVKQCYPGQIGCQPEGQYPGQTGGKQCYPGQIGCQPQTSGQYPGQSTPSSHGTQPGKQCYPGQLNCQEEQSPSGYQPGKQCYPGQIGCQADGKLPSGSQTQPGKTPSCYPGQPGCGTQKPQSIPSCYPGQPGCQEPGRQGIPTTHPEKPQTIPTCYPGQIGCDSEPGRQGIPTTHPEKPQNIPTCYPGKPGCGSQSYPGQKPEPIPSCYPGQPGCSGSQTGPTSQPGYGGFTHSQTGSSSFGASGSGSTSYTGGSFGQKPTGPGSYPTGSPFGQKPFQGSGKTPDTDGELSLRCGGTGYFCVEKYLCNNGIISTSGSSVFQTKTEDQYCNVNTQVCCRLPSLKPDQNQPGSYYHSQSSHASSAASSAATSSSSNTFFTSNIPGSGPTVASHIASQYTPSRSNFPDSTSSGSFQSGLVHIPPTDLKPGQTIPFSGNSGNSPGLIHVVPEVSSPGPFSSSPALLHYPSGGGLIHVKPNGESDLPKPFTSGPNYVTPNAGGNKHVTPSESNFKDVKNELGFASTIQGPAYLPPDSSPTPNTYTPDLEPPKVIYSPKVPSPSEPTPSVLVPQRPVTYSPQSTTTKPYYSPQPTQPKVYYTPQPTTPKPVYYQPTTTKKPQNYLPPQFPSPSDNTNEYLPPPQKPTQRPYQPQIPDSNVININILKPPTKPTVDIPLRPAPAGTSETRLRPPTSPRPVTEYPFKGDLNTTPYPGCAAALKCVEAQYCTADGVISPSVVVLTKEQDIHRVPTTDCADPESGIIGKCCRDPNYKDPWPASQLGLYNPDDGFDNGQYKETQSVGKYGKPPGVKGPQPGIKGRPNRPFQDPNQIGSPSNNPGTFVRPDNQGYPSQVPGIPFDYRQVNTPLQVDVKGPIEINLHGKQPYSPSKISSQTCGVRRPGGNPKGQEPIDVDFAEIPWQAMILRDSNRSLLCGGAIIRRDAVLTAAHCVEGLHSDDVLVKGGEWKLGIDEEPKPFQIIKVAAIVRHPGYNPNNRFNDVAILILTEKFRLDKNVDTICLPGIDTDVESTFQNSKCVTTGWGKTILQLHLLNSLMHSLNVGIVPATQCQATLQKFHSQSVPYYNTNCLCGATTDPNTDICDVDIGSALACDRGDGHYTLAGVYSWDTNCGSHSQLAGYTKVDTLWIESQLQRPINDLKTEENGFYQRLNHQHTGDDCHCNNGKK